MPGERVSRCGRQLVPNKSRVEVMHTHSTEHDGHAYYKNLYTCGSVWMCPVCAAKISERRRLELQEGLDRWRADGHAVLLVTFTMRHHLGERCSSVLGAIEQAHHRFWADRAGQSLAASVGYVGKVRGLEPTEGENGWHVHFHDIIFLQRELTDDELTAFQAAASEHWRSVLARYERFASMDHGLQVERGWEKVGDYVAKFGDDDGGWTLAHEVAKAHVKKASAKGRTPNQLLACSMAGDEHAGQLWVEYAMAFKGKRQIAWSKGLRELLGLGHEKTDAELAVEPQDSADVVLARLDWNQWRAVMGNACEAELLDIADAGDWKRVRDFLESLGIIGVEYPMQFEESTRSGESCAQEGQEV